MIDLVTPALRDPLAPLALDLAGWDLLIRQARAANLLARLAHDLQQADRLDAVPAAPRAHLQGAHVLAQRQRIEVRTEARRVAQALADVDLPLVLLKGAAYALADLPWAAGRLFGDIDLIVPRTALADAETGLLCHGWISSHLSPYDQKYYRRWMHELPPLAHTRRQTVLDVHHNILPATARHPPDAGLLLAQAQPIPTADGCDIRVLCPTDMVLHSACHLFHEGELDNGLRDLADLDGLLRHFGNAAFWPALLARSEVLHLQRPLYYALHLCQEILATPVPLTVMEGAGTHAPGYARLMDALYRRALRPVHYAADDRFTPLARWLLYIRGHWLRMPPHLLAWHLGRKALVDRFGLDEAVHPA
ncbi:MAG: nucleotidyltransferase family protein [Rhodocyclaceae bacterium]